MKSIGATPALPANIQARLNNIEARVIQRNQTKRGMSELDLIMKGDPLISRKAAYSGDSLHLNYAGGKVGK